MLKRKVEIEMIVNAPVGQGGRGARFEVRGYFQRESFGGNPVEGWFGAQLNGDMTKGDALKTATEFFSASDAIVEKLIVGK